MLVNFHHGLFFLGVLINVTAFFHNFMKNQVRTFFLRNVLLKSMQDINFTRLSAISVLALMMSNHLVRDLPLPLLPEPLPRRSLFREFRLLPLSHIQSTLECVSRMKHSLIGSCILLAIDVLVCCKIWGIVSISHGFP